MAALEAAGEEILLTAPQKQQKSAPSAAAAASASPSPEGLLDDKKLSTIQTMKEEIDEKFRMVDAQGSGIQEVNLEYRDIKLDLYLNKLGKDDSEIKISAFSRGHYVRKNPLKRIMHRPSRVGEPASCPGDGSLFLALTVIYCSETLKPSVWIGGVTDWWRRFGSPCYPPPDTCPQTEKSRDAYEIDSNKFLEWAYAVLERCARKGGRRNRRSRKIKRRSRTIKRRNRRRKMRKTRRKTITRKRRRSH